MLARFFNDYEEIKDSTNKNKLNKKAEPAAAVTGDIAPVVAEATEGDIDMLSKDEDDEEGGVKLDEDEVGIEKMEE